MMMYHPEFRVFPVIWTGKSFVCVFVSFMCLLSPSLTAGPDYLSTREALKEIWCLDEARVWQHGRVDRRYDFVLDSSFSYESPVGGYMFNMLGVETFPREPKRIACGPKSIVS